MAQLTVERLYKSLGKLVKAGQGNKKIVISDDNEGNGYHGCFLQQQAILKPFQALLI